MFTPGGLILALSKEITFREEAAHMPTESPITAQQEAGKSDNLNLRILVVDDNRDGAESMAVLLRIYGYQAEPVFNGREALRKAQAKQPDVVLLDICMPGMNGYDLARELRKQFQSKLTLIAISAHDSDQFRQWSTEAGLDCHFEKPVDAEGLLRRLRDIKDSHAV
jgi:CheY-like chemotaxis protein